LNTKIGRPKSGSPRKFKVTVRFTADEIEKIKLKKGSMSMAEFIREKIK
jgi:hypothetical protein